MLLWPLSGARHADAFDGGYGVLFDDRWNTVGHAVTYCSTSPSLCLLEKLVYIEDPTLLPAMVMLTYDAPDELAREVVTLTDMRTDWRRQEGWTQQRGDRWHQPRGAPLLFAPSAIVPLPGSPDVNVLINHAHQATAAITLRARATFALDPRLF